jgi:hypothetical protein
MRRFRILMIFAILLLSFDWLNCKEIRTDDENHRLWLDCNLNSYISFDIFNQAITGFRKIENARNKSILTVIDYSKPSTEKRFYVIDLANKRLLYNCFVAHGKNSGENSVTSFSNIPNSLQSSLGFYLTDETYMGENGYSMKLDGLENNFNSNARSRDIVIHGADYVSEEYIKKYGRLGRSWGCPALPLDLSKEIIDKISNGSCLFIYGADNNYQKNSTFIK